MAEPTLIQIHPRLEVAAVCPKCQSDSSLINDYLFQGIHVLVNCTCNRCTALYYYTLPIAHDAITPIGVSHDGKHAQYDPTAKVWLAQPLINSILQRSVQLSPEIKKKNKQKLKSDVIILNCLDRCFGHSYAKMLNALQLMRDYPDHSLVLLITPNIEWLVPDGVDELWLVPGKMSDMSKYITTLQSFVKAEINKTGRCYLSTAKVFHRLETIDSEPFLRTKRFEISKFNILPPTITFVLREDRYWHANRFDDFINRASIKFKITNYFRWYFVWRQNRLVEKTIRLILKGNPKVRINITGIGSPGGINSGTTDARSTIITEDTERQWCGIYSNSHVIIGVHGSNMMIPTSLAAGFIDIIPAHKIPHLGEDTVVYHTGRQAMLFGRHVDVFASPGLVAEHGLHMLRSNPIRNIIPQSA